MDSEDRDHFKTMQNPLAPLLDGLQKKPNGASSHLGLDPAYCLKMTQTLFSCYRKDEAHDPEIYCAAVAATLADFPRQVVDYVTDPRTGLPSESKFLPNVQEVRAACVRESERRKVLAQPRRVAKYEPPPPKPAGDLFVGVDMPRYSLMREMLAKEPHLGRTEANGIWVPHAWYEQGRISQVSEEARMASARYHFERECRDEGIDPALGVSPSLLKMIGGKA